MEIIRLDKSVYEGKKFTARYKTSGYYDIRAFNDGFKIEYLRLKEPIEKSFEDEFFGKWLENPTAYGVRGQKTARICRRLDRIVEQPFSYKQYLRI